MNVEFVKGTYYFHKEPNFNYQMNRWVAFGNLPVQDVQKAAEKIKNINDWKREFLKLVEEAKSTGDVKRQACYYRAENHCQFGNLYLVLKQMINWIENTNVD
jgi:hypothetical protein